MNEPISEINVLKLRLIDTQKVFALVKYLNKVGHDSNNHVSTVSAGLQLSRAKFDPSEPLYKIVDRSLECTNKIAKTFKDFQMFKQFNKLQTYPFVLSGLILEAIELVMFKHSGKQIIIDFSADTGNFKIDGDYSQLLQVLFHALENSIEASEDHGKIAVSVHKEMWSQKSGVCIEIKDWGKGLPEIIKVQLFQPFATTKMTSGSGLGLFLINSIVGEHKGEVSFDSDDGCTNLKIFLPLTE